MKLRNQINKNLRVINGRRCYRTVGNNPSFLKGVGVNKRKRRVAVVENVVGNVENVQEINGKQILDGENIIVNGKIDYDAMIRALNVLYDRNVVEIRQNEKICNTNEWIGSQIEGSLKKNDRSDDEKYNHTKPFIIKFWDAKTEIMNLCDVNKKISDKTNELLDAQVASLNNSDRIKMTRYINCMREEVARRGFVGDQDIGIDDDEVSKKIREFCQSMNNAN
jgi:hypothetical protein